MRRRCWLRRDHHVKSIVPTASPHSISTCRSQSGRCCGTKSRGQLSRRRLSPGARKGVRRQESLRWLSPAPCKGPAAVAPTRLGKRVLDNTMLTTSTKMKVYQACVLRMLLYGTETSGTRPTVERLSFVSKMFVNEI